MVAKARTRAESPVGGFCVKRLHLFCASVVVAGRYKVCETDNYVFAALAGLGVGGSLGVCDAVGVTESV